MPDVTLTTTRFRRFMIMLSALVLAACIDPVSPDFEFGEGLLFVEGFASTDPGASFVTIQISAIEFGVEVVNFVPGARVVMIEETSDTHVQLTEIQGAYVPPADFFAKAGERWQLDITLQDGRTIRSSVEQVREVVPVTDIKASYNPELIFREASEAYVPGHEIYIDFSDPGDRENFYYWRYRVFENMDSCETCYEGIFRDGKCLGKTPADSFEPYYNYQCQSDCWQIRYPEEIQILDDRFINGLNVQAQAVARLPLYTKEDMVVEIQQMSISPEAFEYYRVLKDLIDNNSGINAPPPAGLVGNLTDTQDDSAFVFGRFTTVAATAAYLFVDRSNIPEDPIESQLRMIREECEVCPPDEVCPVECSPVTTAPCSETRFRTSMMPAGWINQ